MWCNVMYMANRSIDKNNETVRASVSFPQNDYSYLEEIAMDKKVSVAWVVREAVEEYIKVYRTSENTNYNRGNGQ